MKSKRSLLVLISLCCSIALAAPFDEVQIAFNKSSLGGAFGISNIRHSVLDYIQDGKKNILKGKKNMQKWIHKGKEYVKQNDLLCKIISSLRVK